MNLRELYMEEKLVVKRSKKDFEKEWKWLFDGLPMRHRASLESRDGINWLKVSFVDGHRRSWSTEKYLLRDLLQHRDEYRKAVEAQCTHAMHELANAPASPSRGRKASGKKPDCDGFESAMGDLMVSKLASHEIDELLEKHGIDKGSVTDIVITVKVSVKGIQA